MRSPHRGKTRVVMEPWPGEQARAGGSVLVQPNHQVLFDRILELFPFFSPLPSTPGELQPPAHPPACLSHPASPQQVRSRLVNEQREKATKKKN